MSGDGAHPPADPAHAQDADRQLVQLHPALCVADLFEFPGLVSAVLEKRPRPEQLQRIAEHEVANRERVRIGRVHHLHTAGPACPHINVLDAHPAAADHLQVRAAGQQRGIHPCVGAHHHTFHFWQGSIELGGIGSGLDNSGPLFQPRQGRCIGAFGDQNGVCFCHGDSIAKPPDFS